MTSASRRMERELSHCHRRAVKLTGAGARPRVLPLALLALLCLPSVARAHPQYSPTKSNRYLKLALGGGGAVRLSWSLLVGETPALAVRRAADGNGDGLASEEELGGFARGLLGDVREHLVLEVDGVRATASWDEPIVGLSDRRVGPVPFSVDLMGKLPVPADGKPHVVRVDDVTTIEELGESEIRVEEGPGTRVVAGWQGREDGGRVLRWVWNGPKFSSLEDRSIGFRFVEDRPAPRRRFRLPVGAIAAVVGAAIALALARRSRRGRASGAEG